MPRDDVLREELDEDAQARASAGGGPGIPAALPK